MDAWGDCRMQQHKSQWAVIHSENSKDGKADCTQHKAHLEHTNNDRKVSQGADNQRPWMFRRHIHKHKLN